MMPASGTSSRLHSRSKVVLPAPDGPDTTVIPAAGIEAVTVSRTRRPARNTVTRSNSNPTASCSPIGYSCASTPAVSPLPVLIPDEPFPTWPCPRVTGSVCTAESRGVLLRGHPVQLHRARVAERQVEHPPVMDVEPVVGQLLRRPDDCCSRYSPPPAGPQLSRRSGSAAASPGLHRPQASTQVIIKR